MDSEAILSNLKELTLDLSYGRRTKEQIVRELDKRINPLEIYDMPSDTVNYRFIQAAYWGLRHLLHGGGFDTEPEFIEYLVECFEGDRTYSSEDWTNYLHKKKRGK